MRLITFCRTDNPAAHVGVRQGHRIVDLGPGRMKDLLAAGRAGLERAGQAHGPVLDERAIRYLPPIPDADKFLCVGKNYRQHLAELRANELLTLPVILEHFSRYIPFEPGDLFSTGAPGGVAVGKPNAAELFLKPGDVVECSIDGVATLRTYIV